MLSDRQRFWAFALGCLAVTAGVLLHLPMFLMGRHMHFMLAGMPMGWRHDLRHGADRRRRARSPPTACCRATSRRSVPRRQDIVVSPPEDAPLGRAHWRLMVVLIVALIIDMMKPASPRLHHRRA